MDLKKTLKWAVGLYAVWFVATKQAGEADSVAQGTAAGVVSFIRGAGDIIGRLL